jgi:hypothetical protein
MPMAPVASPGASDGLLLRVGAVAAVGGAVASLIATVAEPDSSGDPTHAVRVVANSSVWTFDRLLDLIGALLLVGGLTVCRGTFAKNTGYEWARVGQPFLVLMGALGAGAVISGATMKDMADAWTAALPQPKQSYLAAFDASSNATDDLYFGAFLALGMYSSMLAAAILTGGPYSRRLGWAVAVSAALVTSGDLLMVVVGAAFVAVLVGYLLFLLVAILIGTAMWRGASHSPRPVDIPSSPSALSTSTSGL